MQTVRRWLAEAGEAYTRKELAKSGLNNEGIEEIIREVRFFSH